MGGQPLIALDFADIAPVLPLAMKQGMMKRTVDLRSLHHSQVIFDNNFFVV